jgi:hypothetical protein
VARAENAQSRIVEADCDVIPPVAALGTEDLQRIADAVTESNSYAGTDVLAWFERRLALCHRDDGVAGPRYVLSDVLGLLSVVEPTLARVPAPLINELLSAGARAAEFAAWLYQDAGVPVRSEHWLNTAMEWAQIADDTAMQGYVLLKKSQNAWRKRDAVRMLALARVVQETRWRVPAWVRAEAAQQEARGYAMLGAPFAEVVRKLHEAERVLDAADKESAGTTECGRLSAHYDGGLLRLQGAICYAESGRADLALDVYREVLRPSSLSRRDYGYFLSLRSAALVSANEPDEAAVSGLEALTVAVQTNSVRTLRELLRSRQRLTRWGKRPAVAEFSEATRPFMSVLAAG